MRWSILFYVLGLSIFMGSCSKTDRKQDPDTGQTAPGNAMANITDKYFILSSATSNPAFPLDNGSTTTDIYKDWYRDECVLDDVRWFKSNGEWIWDNGATKCDPDEIQADTLQWRFIENFSKIETTTNIVDTLKVLINDGKTLRYERKIKRTTGAVPSLYVWTETWVRKQ